MTQRLVAVRVPEETLDGLDQLVAEGRYATRSACIKDALDQLLATFERRRIDDAIIAGYEKMPLTDEELAWTEASANEMFARWAEDPEDW
jgi:Arc/MetJ-type ribon-helix-helix transcriptional regulator